jgi:hypothetical protein
MESARAADEPTGKWLGLSVFVLGIIFLVLVFFLAFRDLMAAGVLGQLSSPSPSLEATSAIVALGVKFVLFVVLGYVGSAVAGRGIGLYAASRADHDD